MPCANTRVEKKQPSAAEAGSIDDGYGTTKGVPLQSYLQGLKPASICELYDTTEVVP